MRLQWREGMPTTSDPVAARLPPLPGPAAPAMSLTQQRLLRRWRLWWRQPALMPRWAARRRHRLPARPVSRPMWHRQLARPPRRERRPRARRPRAAPLCCPVSRQRPPCPWLRRCPRQRPWRQPAQQPACPPARGPAAPAAPAPPCEPARPPAQQPRRPCAPSPGLARPRVRQMQGRRGHRLLRLPSPRCHRLAASRQLHPPRPLCPPCPPSRRRPAATRDGS